MYLALYRKYRPRTFDDVISQPHIVTTLKNQIATGQNAHAYLFTGSRGTGKTTCSKILAMALNCQHPVDGNPCLECPSCREIASGESTDILEIDAASNSSVNDVHDLQDQLAYTPVSCKYRVYILDEVHMLSKAAFNALLKTIEEPPPHVIFIFATTELHKVPATILSRCQRFEFRRIDIADSSARLMSVAQNEGVTLTQEAADMISRLSDGGMRDALSLLDRCIAMSRDVTADVVRSCAGVADNHHLFRFADLIAARDIPGCVTLLEQLYKGGKDIARVMEELNGVFRDIMLCSSAPAEKGLLSVMPSDYPEIERLAGLFSLGEILRCLTLIQECCDKITNSRNRRTLAEMCFVKLCTDAPTAEQSAAAAHPAIQPRPAPKLDDKPMGREFAPLPDDKLNPQAARNLSQIQKLFSDPEPVKPEAPAEKPTAAAIPPKPAENTEGAPVMPEVDRKTAANISKVHEITSQFTQVKPTEKPKSSAAASDVPLPELNSRPAAPEPMEFAPPPEEPPEEYIPPREFEIPSSSSVKPSAPLPQPVKPAAPVKAAEPVKSVEPEKVPAPEKVPEPEIVPEPEENPVPEKAPEPEKAAEPVNTPAPDTPVPESTETKPENVNSGYEKLSGITPEEWKEVLGKIMPLYSAMLDDAQVSVNADGALEIRSGNLMLQEMAAKSPGELEDELEPGFGKKVHVLVIGIEQKKTDGEETSAVKELLDKARQLGIEVVIKNNAKG